MAVLSVQAPVTSTLTTIFTAFTSFGLTAVSAWFASERWIYLRHQGRKWLSDALTDYTSLLTCLPGMSKAKALLNMTYSLLLRWADNIHWFDRSSLEQSSDVEVGLVLPIAHTDDVHQEAYTSPLHRQSDVGSELLKSPPLSFTSSAMNDESITRSTSPTPVSPGRQLWTSAMRTVKMHSAVASSIKPRSQSTTSSNMIEHTKMLINEVEPGRAVTRSRVAVLSPKLKQLEATQDIAAHTGLVRHLQFSPDGRYLATSRYTRPFCFRTFLLDVLL